MDGYFLICPSDVTYSGSTQQRITSYTTNKDVFDPGLHPNPASGRLSQYNMTTAFGSKGSSDTVMLAERVVQCNTRALVHGRLGLALTLRATGI